MLWIRFDEGDRRSPAPDFCLETFEGELICKSNFRGDCNLVVVFSHSADCETCMDLLRGFVKQQQRYQAEDTRVLVVFPDSIDELQTAVQSQPFLTEDPLTLLADPEGRTRQKYAALMDESLISATDVAFFVLDSYGAPYAALVGPELEDASLHSDTLSWLSFIGMQCPE